MLDKLKASNNSVGNKLDVTGGKILGNLNILDNAYFGKNGVAFGAPYDEDEGGALQLLGKDITKQKILWNDYLYMQGNHTITLSEKVSEQKNGIILVFSGYSNGSPENWNWSSYFISKKEVELTEGAGHIFFGGGTQGLASFKYIYIYNDRLEGNNCNILQNDTYDNKGSVLRYVIGV